MSEASVSHRTSCLAAPAATLAACRPYVVRYLRSLGASVEDSEDLAQDTLLTAWRSLSGFRGDSRLSTWLCRIARRTYTHWRAQAVPCVALPREEDVPLVEGPEHEILLRIALCEALDHLPEPLRLLVCRHYLQGCSYCDLCMGRKITRSKLTNQLSAARRLLRQHLALPGP